MYQIRVVFILIAVHPIKQRQFLTQHSANTVY